MTQQVEADGRVALRYSLRGIEEHSPVFLYFLGFVSTLVVLFFFEPPLSNGLWVAFIVIQVVMVFSDRAVPRDRMLLLAMVRMSPPLFFNMAMFLNAEALGWRLIWGAGSLFMVSQPWLVKDGFAEIHDHFLLLKGTWRKRRVELSRVASVRAAAPHRWPSSLAPTVIIALKREPRQLWPWRHKVRINVAWGQVEDFVSQIASRIQPEPASS